MGASFQNYEELNFNLTQELSSIFDQGSQTGSLLTQTYTITNTTASPLNFDLVRYLDGDLNFNDDIDDGGGRIAAGAGGTETLFETDSATASTDPTTFVGITSEGGTIPQSNRYEISEFSELRTKIQDGGALDELIQNDSNGDQFVDAGSAYDVTLALRNVFLLAPGETTTYTTETIFGERAFNEIVDPDVSVPEPSSILGLLTFGVLGASSVWKRRQHQNV